MNHSKKPLLPTSTPLVFKHSGSRLGGWGALALVAALSGCASLGAPADPEQAVTQRADQRWNLLVKGDFKQAYEFFTPSYRAVTSFDTYRKQQGTAVTWTGGGVAKVRCPETTKCTVTLRVEAKPFLGRKYGDKIVTHVEETWLLENGQWWLFQRI